MKDKNVDVMVIIVLVQTPLIATDTVRSIQQLVQYYEDK